MRRLFIDIESRSKLDLNTVGLMKYADDRTTEITCVAWTYELEPVNVWHFSEPVPDELIKALKDQSCEIVSHNSLFDKTMIVKKLMPALLGRQMHMWDLWTHHTDTMAISCYNRIGASLEDAAKYLRLEGKFAEGKKMMQKQTRLNRKGEFYELNKEEIELLKEYARQDVEICRAIYYHCSPLPVKERQLWEWTISRNEKGLFIDVPLLEAMDNFVQEEKSKAQHEFLHITGLKTGSIKFRDWLEERGVSLPNLQADTIKLFLDARPQIHKTLKHLLELKLLCSKSSLGKVAKASNIYHHGRVYETLQYHKAQTKRFSGGGIQPQNLPRSEGISQLDPNDPDFSHKLRAKLNGGVSSLDEVKDNLRRLFIAPKGKKFYCGDFARIEPEVLFWLCNQGAVPSRWYEKTAAAIYRIDHQSIKKDSVERHIGKTIALSSLYGQGHKRFRDDMMKEGIELTVAEAKNAIYTFRNTYSFIPKLWKALDEAFYQALTFKKKVTWTDKNIAFEYNKKFNRMELTIPSGGKLFYNKPTATADGFGNKRITYWDMNSNKKDKTTEIWGGTFTEHLVSATAREVLANAIMVCYNDVTNDLTPVCCVHDEIWCYGSPNQMDDFKEYMQLVPHWAKGLKVRAECMVGERYLK